MIDPVFNALVVHAVVADRWGIEPRRAFVFELGKELAWTFCELVDAHVCRDASFLLD